MKYLDGICDKGIVLSPDQPGESMYAWDGGGAREAIINQSGDTYYLGYDGAMPGERSDSYWHACQARSKDLIHWEKLGTKLLSSALTHPDSSEAVYKDFRSATAAWSIETEGRWHHFYMGADHCSEHGVPAFWYTTLHAVSDTIDGEWVKDCDSSGREKHISISVGKPGTWNDITCSPGQVIVNPRWNMDPEHEKKYLMFYSGSCSGVTKRSIGIARTNDLSVGDDFDKQEGNFWEKDPDPILSPDEDIENTSIYYEEESGLYYLFTNHIYQNAYTDSVWVYWTDDLEHWNPDNKAIVIDASVSTWAKGAIGMPTVIKKDDHTLALFYDACNGTDKGHLHRHIGLAEISLPIKLK